MNPLTCLPNEILFQCVSGSSTPHLDRSSIRNFGFQCRNLRETCSSIKVRIDECWKVCLGTLWEDWKNCSELKNLTKEQFISQQFPSFRFVLNWIDGKPNITKPTLIDALKHNFGLEIKPEDELKIRQWDPDKSIPIRFMIQGNILGCARNSDGDAFFLNLTTKKFIGEIHDSNIQFHEDVKPIIYENSIFFLAITSNKYELYHYEMGSEGIFLKKIIPLHGTYHIMHLEGDHIIFWSGNFQISQFSAISIDDLIHSDIPEVILSDKLEKFFDPEKLNNTLLVRSIPANEICFHRIQIKNQKIQLNDLISIGTTLTFHSPLPIKPPCWFSSALHVKDNSYVFIADYTWNDIMTFGSLSADVHHPLTSISVVNQSPRIGMCLIKFKDSLLTLDSAGNQLKLRSVNIEQGQVGLTPLDIMDPETYKFSHSTGYCHLDKLFLIGYFDKGGRSTINNPYLLIVNLHSNVVEFKYPLDKFYSLPVVEIMETSPGCILVFNQLGKTIYKIDYNS